MEEKKDVLILGIESSCDETAASPMLFPLRLNCINFMAA